MPDDDIEVALKLSDDVFRRAIKYVSRGRDENELTVSELHKVRTITVAAVSWLAMDAAIEMMKQERKKI